MVEMVAAMFPNQLDLVEDIWGLFLVDIMQMFGEMIKHETCISAQS
jgi:hypothetical protein